MCAGRFPVALQLVVAVYEVKTWLKQLVCTWIQSSSGWIRFLSCSFSTSEADLLSGGFASKSHVSAGSIEHRSGCWALLTAAGGQLWHGRGGLSLRAVSWQQDLPVQLVFLPSQGGYFPLFPPNPAWFCNGIKSGEYLEVERGQICALIHVFNAGDCGFNA